MKRETSIIRMIMNFGSYNVVKPDIHWIPSMDVYEYQDKFIVLVELPGVKKEDIDITVKDNILKISGYRKELMSGERVRIHQMEMSYGYFERILEVYNINPEKISAQLNDGILLIVLPKF